MNIFTIPLRLGAGLAAALLFLSMLVWLAAAWFYDRLAAKLSYGARIAGRREDDLSGRDYVTIASAAILSEMKRDEEPWNEERLKNRLHSTGVTARECLEFCMEAGWMDMDEATGRIRATPKGIRQSGMYFNRA